MLKACGTVITQRFMNRRELLRLALGSPVCFASLTRSQGQGRLSLQSIASSPATIVPSNDAVELTRQWNGPLCRTRLINHGRQPVKIKEVVLFSFPLNMPPSTKLYGEGFQMLSQTGGTLAQPVDYSAYTDAKHYKLETSAGERALYGMMMLSESGSHNLLAFTSCHRFSGQFYLSGGSLKVAIDTEGLELQPGETWQLEEFTFRSGDNREELLRQLADRLATNHKPLQFKSPPTGWCSWYCFGPKVTAQQVLDNLEFIAGKAPGLRYVQIDDGYQPAMGDWLETGAAFGGDVQSVLKAIRQRGFEPAIWVAPFVAEEGSHLFQQHPDWFVKGPDGKQLRSDRVTFGGWRRGPWYALDGTNPDAQRHLELVFRTMRNEWGCTYFKLDANFWGAMHGGRHYDAKATRIEAYRRGMGAVIKGAGDSFILGCNHPMWASLGLIHGSRSSNDIKRSWDRIASTGRQNLSRNWQNGRLWWNDPDAVVLSGDLSKDEVLVHASVIHASGGMLLSGDDLTQLAADRLAILRRLLPPTGVAARFEDDSLRVGMSDYQGGRMVYLFNWGDSPQTLRFNLQRACEITDYWSGQAMGRHERSFSITEMPPHSARILVCS
jgi:alpha-galactosidase